MLLDLNLLICDHHQISRASDEDISHFGEKYAPGTTHACRVVGQNLLDGALVLSLKSSEVSGTFMTYDELRLGQKVKGTIATVSEKGIKVQLAHGVKGLMPLLHGGDMPLAFANVQKKFQVGAALSCRVRTHTHTLHTYTSQTHCADVPLHFPLQHLLPSFW